MYLFFQSRGADLLRLAICLLMICSAPVFAQVADTNKDQAAATTSSKEFSGEAQVALQGYYAAAAGTAFLGTSGMAGTTAMFIPGLGLLKAGLEGYGSNGFHSGNVYLGVEGLARWGWHWDLMGGDFKFASSLTESPFNNVYRPEISARGARIVMKRANRTYQLFAGKESVLGGPRIPYRTLLPQTVLGATMHQKLSDQWEVGVRYLHLTTSEDVFGSKNAWSLPGHSFLSADSLQAESSYTIIPGTGTHGLKFYSELSLSRATSPAATTGTDVAPANAAPLSFFAGPSWESDKVTIKANYVRQSASYMPLLGLFAGDREGPYAEAHFRPFGWLDLYGSGNIYSNNLEANPELVTFHSKGYGGGLSLTLPWRFSASGSVSTIQLQQTLSNAEVVPSNNQQVSVSLNRPVGRHNLRIALTDLKLANNGELQHQRLTEAGDTFSWKWLSAGLSARLQQSESVQNRTTVFYRGSLAGSWHGVNFHGNVDLGSDVLNQSVFSTSTFNTTVIGVTAPLSRGWRLEAEAFRNKLNTFLNPENAFLFGNTGIGANTQLAAINQWSLLFRMTRELHWGKKVTESGGLAQYAAARVPLVGTVRGMVMEMSLAGPRPAAGVSISIDSNRTTVSDAGGYYAFTEVPEGSHAITLNMEQLPTDYEPGEKVAAKALVVPRSLVRADFSVYRLSGIKGRVLAPKGADLENVVLRLKGSSSYTTPYADGTFAFSNLKEGHYEITLDEKTLPEGFALVSAANLAADANATSPVPPATFEIRKKVVEAKPVRDLKLQAAPIRIK